MTTKQMFYCTIAALCALLSLTMQNSEAFNTYFATMIVVAAINDNHWC